MSYELRVMSNELVIKLTTQNLTSEQTADAVEQVVMFRHQVKERNFVAF